MHTYTNINKTPLSVIVVNNKKTSSPGIFCSSKSSQAQQKENQQQLSRMMKGIIRERQPTKIFKGNMSSIHE